MRIARPVAAAVVVVEVVASVIVAVAVAAATPEPSSVAWSAACSARHPYRTAKSPGAARAFFIRRGLFYSVAGNLAQSALAASNFTYLSPPDVSRHISTSLPAGTGLAQV